MASVDSLSDNEIRSKLAELGSPVGPVTETTRKVLVKKLKRLLQLEQTNATSPSKQRRNLSRFSSGEDDSQGEDVPSMPPPTRVRNLRRRTVGSGDFTSTITDFDDSSTLLPGTNKVSVSKTSRRSIATVVSSPKDADDFDTGSDSDIAETNSDDSVRKRRPLRSEPLTPPRRIATPRSVITGRDYTSKTIDSSRAYDISKDNGKGTLDEENTSARSSGFVRPDVPSRFGEWSRPTNTVYRSSLSSQYESPSAFSSRITKKADGTDIFQKRVSDLEFTDEHQKRVLAAREYLRNKALEPKTSVKSNGYDAWFFSKYHNNTMVFVVIGVVLLFLILGIFYLSFVSTALGIDGDDNIYPLCESGQNQTVCIETKNLDAALKVFKLIAPKLQDTAVKAYCSSSGDPLESSIVSEKAALAYIITKLPQNKSWELERNLRDAKILVLSNPHWDFQVVDQISSGISTDDVKTLVVTGGLVCVNPSLPIGCYLRNALYDFGWWALLLLVISSVIGGALYGMRWYKRKQDRHKCNVYTMVNKILVMLQNHYRQDQEPSYLAVDNCRDELIAPLQRDALKKVWENAVDFIEKHESRVRTEMHNLQGENIKIWRWLPAGGPPLSPSSLNTSFDRLL